jgi:hypothetical protein
MTVNEQEIVISTWTVACMCHAVLSAVHRLVSVGMMGLHMALGRIVGGHHFLGLMQGVVSVRISVEGEQ